MKTNCIRVGWLAAAMVLIFGHPIFADSPALTDSLRLLIEADWEKQDLALSAASEKSLAATATPVTTAEDASGGCNGIKTGLWGFHVASGEQDPWWQVDLGREYPLDRVVVYNRCGSTAARTRHLQILVAGSDGDDGLQDVPSRSTSMTGRRFSVWRRNRWSSGSRRRASRPASFGFEFPGVVRWHWTRSRSTRSTIPKEYRFEPTGRSDQRQPVFPTWHDERRGVPSTWLHPAGSANRRPRESVLGIRPGTGRDIP
jgi:hypothetical protein